MLDFFIKGILVGVLTSIPLGPLAILCIQRTLNKGRTSGFITGLGTVLADTTFAALIILGLSFVNKILDTYYDIVISIGGIIIMTIGFFLFRSNPIKKVKRPKESSSASDRFCDFISAFVMTITNPGAFLLLLGILSFIGLEVSPEDTATTIGVTLFGVACGASAWWFTLSTLINLFRSKFRLRMLLNINRVAGIALVIWGAISLVKGAIKVISQYIG